MIKVLMNNGEAYELECKDIEEFKNKYLYGMDILENKIIEINDGVSINLMAISSIEKEKYINGINTIIP